MTAPIISIPKNFHMNLIQFDHSIFAIAREPDQAAGGRDDQVCESITELERKDGCLSRNTDQIRNRYHKRHGNRSLSSTGGDHTVDK